MTYFHAEGIRGFLLAATAPMGCMKCRRDVTIHSNRQVNEASPPLALPAVDHRHKTCAIRGRVQCGEFHKIHFDIDTGKDRAGS